MEKDGPFLSRSVGIRAKLVRESSDVCPVHIINKVLSDIPEEFYGNFTARPGSHHVLTNHLRKNPAVLKALEQHGNQSLPRDLPFAAPVQVLDGMSGVCSTVFVFCTWGLLYKEQAY